MPWKPQINLQVVQSILNSENQHRKKNKIQFLFPHLDQNTIPIRPFLIYQKIYLQLVFAWNMSFHTLPFPQLIHSL